MSQKKETETKETSETKISSRRDFLKTSSTVAAAGAVVGSIVAPKLAIARSAHAFGSDTIKIGLVVVADGEPVLPFKP